MTGNNDTTTESMNAAKMPLVIHAQYIKDLSFENPNPGVIHDPNGPRPAIDVNFSVDAVPVPSQQYKAMYEVRLGVTARASRDGKPAFIAQALYGVLVSLDDVPEDHQHPLLFIETPRHAFPFVRMIIANLTQQGGYMPLLLAPVDFRALYMQRFAEEMKNGSGEKNSPKKQAAQ